MKTKTMIIIGVVIAVLAVAYFVFFKGKSTTAADTTSIALGKKKNGSDYFQADIDKKMKEIAGSTEWYKAIVTKAAEQKRTPAEQLKLDSIWMLENGD